jgi:hypothetical protein
MEEEKTVYLFSVDRFSRFEIEHMRPSDFPEFACKTMTMEELESHWNIKKNGGLTMDIEKYWCRIV